MANAFFLGENEKILKRYPLQKLETKEETTDSALAVTNRRIVYTQDVKAKNGDHVFTKRDFDINTIDTVSTDFAFKKYYHIGWIIFFAMMALGGLIFGITAEENGLVGWIIMLIGAVGITLCILLAKNRYRYYLILSSFASSETCHISLGSSTLIDRRKKEKKVKRSSKLVRFFKKLFAPKISEKGIYPESVEQMVSEIGSYIVEYKEEV